MDAKQRRLSSRSREAAPIPPSMVILTLAAVVVLGVVVFTAIARSRDERPRLEVPHPAAGPAPAPGDVDASIVELVRSGRKIEAIKAYRAQYGVGLKEAKEAVESL